MQQEYTAEEYAQWNNYVLSHKGVAPNSYGKNWNSDTGNKETEWKGATTDVNYYGENWNYYGNSWPAGKVRKCGFGNKPIQGVCSMLGLFVGLMSVLLSTLLYSRHCCDYKLLQEEAERNMMNNTTTTTSTTTPLATTTTTTTTVARYIYTSEERERDESSLETLKSNHSALLVEEASLNDIYVLKNTTYTDAVGQTQSEIMEDLEKSEEIARHQEEDAWYWVEHYRNSRDAENARISGERQKTVRYREQIDEAEVKLFDNSCPVYKIEEVCAQRRLGEQENEDDESSSLDSTSQSSTTGSGESTSTDSTTSTSTESTSTDTTSTEVTTAATYDAALCDGFLNDGKTAMCNLLNFDEAVLDFHATVTEVLLSEGYTNPVTMNVKINSLLEEFVSLREKHRSISDDLLCHSSDESCYVTRLETRKNEAKAALDEVSAQVQEAETLANTLESEIAEKEAREEREAEEVEEVANTTTEAPQEIEIANTEEELLVTTTSPQENCLREVSFRSEIPVLDDHVDTSQCGDRDFYALLFAVLGVLTMGTAGFGLKQVVTSEPVAEGLNYPVAALNYGEEVVTTSETKEEGKKSRESESRETVDNEMCSYAHYYN